MDERVKRALAQWPNVPDVYGWLSLDKRGHWRLRGETISNSRLIDFINRNYIRLDDGGYAFQNGPQRVHVELEVTPWIARPVLEESNTLHFLSHTDLPLEPVRAVYLDSLGRLFIAAAAGAALLSDQYLDDVLAGFRSADGQPLSAAALEQALIAPQTSGLNIAIQGRCLPVQPLPDEPLESVFHFIARPQDHRPSQPSVGN